MKKSLLVLSFAALGVFANAAVDMNHIDAVSGLFATPGFGVMQIFSDFPTFSGTVVDDFNASGSKVTHVGVAFEATNNAGLPNITGWQISLWNSSAAASTSGNSLNGGTVAQTFIAGPGAPVAIGTDGTLTVFRIDFTGLNLNLGTTGHYWVGVAPAMAFANNGQTFIMSNTTPAVLGAGTANNSVGVNPGLGFGVGNPIAVNTNAAYMVETQPVPEPASIVALSLGGLALLRRRRKVA